jgi:hypothetical protein
LRMGALDHDKLPDLHSLPPIGECCVPTRRKKTEESSGQSETGRRHLSTFKKSEPPQQRPARRWLVWPSRGLRHAPWPLPQHSALRVRGDRELGARDALPSRVFLLHGALRLPCDVVPRVRDVLLPCDDGLLPFLT